MSDNQELNQVLTELARGMTELAKGMSVLNNEERRDLWSAVNDVKKQGTFIELQLTKMNTNLENYHKPCPEVVMLMEESKKRSSFFSGLLRTSAAVIVTGGLGFVAFLVVHWLQNGAPKP